MEAEADLEPRALRLFVVEESDQAAALVLDRDIIVASRRLVAAALRGGIPVAGTTAVRRLLRSVRDDDARPARAHRGNPLVHQAGKTTSARVPRSLRSSRRPCSSSRTSASTMESPVPLT